MPPCNDLEPYRRWARECGVLTVCLLCALLCFVVFCIVCSYNVPYCTFY